jgi:hypothetical protein
MFQFCVLAAAEIAPMDQAWLLVTAGPAARSCPDGTMSAKLAGGPVR